MALSDNGKEILSLLLTKVGDWLAIIAAVLTLWIQSHQQHNDRMQFEEKKIAIATKANDEAAIAAKENTDGLTRLASEVKALQRPLVFAKEK